MKSDTELFHKSGTKHQPEETRRMQILETATHCFIENGYHKTTMRELVEKSGLSKGAIYHYYDSKEAILIGILEHWDQFWNDGLKTLSAEADYLNGMKNYCQTNLSVFSLYKNLSYAFYELRGNKTVEQALSRSWNGSIDAIDELLRKTGYNEVPRKLTSRQLAMSLAAMFEGLIYYASMEDTFDMETEFETIWASFEVLFENRK